jgi:hypothetical protein
MRDRKQTPAESAHPEPKAHGDLPVDAEAADQVTGGDTAQSTPSAFRGRYQLRLNEARETLK